MSEPGYFSRVGGSDSGFLFQSVGSGFSRLSDPDLGQRHADPSGCSTAVPDLSLDLLRPRRRGEGGDSSRLNTRNFIVVSGSLKRDRIVMVFIVLYFGIIRFPQYSTTLFCDGTKNNSLNYCILNQFVVARTAFFSRFGSGCYTVCPGSSDPPEKILNIFASENEVYTVF